jgi:ribonuclease HII
MNSKKPGAPIRRASRSSESLSPHIRYERAAWRSGYMAVAGVDEVGRGAWAGPLVAVALVLPREPRVRSRLTRSLNRAGLSPRDSKLMTHEQRRRVVAVIDQVGLRYSIAEIAAPTVDSIGVGTANFLALREAVERLGEVDYALVDHFAVDALVCDGEPVSSGDRACLSIALASIVAKVHRDALMQSLDSVYPGYGFGAHKGYGTAQHADSLDRLGVTDQHRRSFKPVADRLARA